jgi:hypothetical protein
VRVFFYGLFMDQALLEQKGLQVAGSETSRLDGYDLRIGKRATLAACHGHAVYGVVMDIAREGVEKLYSEVGLREYRPETVTVVLDSDQRVDAVCYNLPESTDYTEPNQTYAAELTKLATALGFPEHYVQSITTRNT